jgi:hypothetical protein
MPGMRCWAGSRQDQTSHTWTLERWLRYWLSTRVGIRPTTRLSHTQYIDRFLIPYLGTIRLAELTTRRLTAFFTAVAQETNRFGQPHTPTSLAHIRTKLRCLLAIFRSSLSSALLVPLYSSKISVSPTEPVSTNAVANMGSEPPFSILHAAPRNRFGGTRAVEYMPPDRIRPDAGVASL